MKVKDLSIDELKALIQEAVEEKFEELLGDPDYGLELKPEIKQQLERSLTAKAKGTPAEKVARELGLEW